jgi:hypothetical protein
MGEEIEFGKKILFEISKIGREQSSLIPQIKEIEPFEYFIKDEKLNNLDKIDGGLTRREILTRYLLLSVVLDQGPDVEGVRLLLRNVINSLYRKEIRIFHRPIDFFKEFGFSIDEILSKHNSVKKIRAEDWARENDSKPSKYNLFFAQSQRGLISINQVLDYSVHRWGAPLCVPLLLEKDLLKSGKESNQPLVDYLESFESSEIMSQQIKDHDRYGLGSAIGDKACHLFAKWYIHTFKLVKRKDVGWDKWSFELPFDSNAGRVLFRSGFLTIWADLSDYEKFNVIQKRKGKKRADGKKTHYIRVTNIRGKKSEIAFNNTDIFKKYVEVCKNHLKIMSNPRSVEIQIIPNALLLGTDFGVGDLDDGLMYIGTNFCFNHETPECEKCPIKSLCKGKNEDNSLIVDYTT